jgi:hypothetical protein
LAWLFWVITALFCAVAAYNLVVFRLTATVFEQCVAILMTVFSIPWILDYLAKDKRQIPTST